MNLNEMIEMEISNGYGDANAQSKVCQDIILKAISTSSLSRNMTIKGGVVMRSRTGNIRRATQDLDIDFIRYSLEDESVDLFIQKLNCINGIYIQRTGDIEELKQQDYRGKRVLIKVSDNAGTSIISKLDLGVHTHLNIEQEEYCFDVAFDDTGASVLVNSNEQMFTEKLKSLLRLGPISTRYKDIFDLYYLSENVDGTKLNKCFETFIFSDEKMREKTIADIEKRLKMVFENKNYIRRIENSKVRWLDEDMEIVAQGILKTFENLSCFNRKIST